MTWNRLSIAPEELKRLTVPALRDLSKRHGLPAWQSGGLRLTKPRLIAALLAFFRDSSGNLPAREEPRRPPESLVNHWAMVAHAAALGVSRADIEEMDARSMYRLLARPGRAAVDDIKHWEIREVFKRRVLGDC